jgi:hypothetical protein
MRCKDRKTEVAVTKWGFVKCGIGVRMMAMVKANRRTRLRIRNLARFN